MTARYLEPKSLWGKGESGRGWICGPDVLPWLWFSQMEADVISRSLFALLYNCVSSINCIACIFADLWKRNVVVSSCCGNNVEFGALLQLFWWRWCHTSPPDVLWSRTEMMKWGEGRWTKMGCCFWPLWNWRCKRTHINLLSPCLSLYAGLTTLQMNGFSLNFILGSTTSCFA